MYASSRSANFYVINAIYIDIPLINLYMPLILLNTFVICIHIFIHMYTIRICLNFGNVGVTTDVSTRHNRFRNVYNMESNGANNDIRIRTLLERVDVQTFLHIHTVISPQQSEKNFSFSRLSTHLSSALRPVAYCRDGVLFTLHTQQCRQSSCEHCPEFIITLARHHHRYTVPIYPSPKLLSAITCSYQFLCDHRMCVLCVCTMYVRSWFLYCRRCG